MPRNVLLYDFDEKWYRICYQKDLYLAKLRERHGAHRTYPFEDHTNPLVPTCECLEFVKCDECQKLSRDDVEYRIHPKRRRRT